MSPRFARRSCDRDASTDLCSSADPGEDPCDDSFHLHEPVDDGVYKCDARLRHGPGPRKAQEPTPFLWLRSAFRDSQVLSFPDSSVAQFLPLPLASNVAGARCHRFREAVRSFFVCGRGGVVLQVSCERSEPVTTCMVLLNASALLSRLHIARKPHLTQSWHSYKLLRGDLRYWPNVADSISGIVSVVARLLVKVIVDFTCCAHYRHPFEFGGFFFAFSVLLSQAMCFVATALYVQRMDADDASTIPRESLWVVTIVSFLGWFVSVLLFFRFSTNKYRKTFFNLQTAKQYATALFRESQEDAVKADACFDNHKSFTLEAKDEIVVWVGENWSRWMREQEPWFVHLRRMIPVDYLPKKVVERSFKDERRQSFSAQFVGGNGLDFVEDEDDESLM